MQLISLKLLGYRRFQKEEIYFSPETTLIFGRNGSGKSSLFDAIGFAFFGGKNKDFLRTTIPEQKSYFLGNEYPSKIELSFLYGASTYTITRVIHAGHKKYADWFISENKDTLLGPDGLHIIGGTEVTNYVENLLGLSRETFLRSVFTRQKDIETLSGKWLADRKDLIHKILGINLIEEKIASIQQENRTLTREKQLYQKRVEDFDEETHKKMKKEMLTRQRKLQKELKNLQKEAEKIKKENAKLAQDWQKEQSKFSEFSRWQTEQKVNQNQHEHTKTLIQNLQQELTDIENAQKEHTKFADLPQKKKDADAKNIEFERLKIQFAHKQKLQISVKEAREQSKNYKKNIQELENQLEKYSLPSLEKEQEDYTKKESEYLVRLSEITFESTQLMDAGKKLKTEYDAFVDLGKESECPTCKRPLQEQFPIVLALFEKELEEKRTAFKKKSAEKQDLEYQRKENTQLLERVKIQIEEIQQLQKKRDEQQYILKNHHEKLEEITHSLEELAKIDYDTLLHEAFQKEYSDLLKEWEIYQKRSLQIEKKPFVESQYKTALQKQESLTKEQQNIETSLKKLQFDQSVYDHISQEYSQVTEKIASIQEQIDTKKDEKISVDGWLAKLEQAYESFQKDAEYISKLSLEIFSTSQIQDCLQAYIAYLLHALKPHIETVASEYFSLMTDGLYSQITLDDDYHILIDGKTIDMYSGWEKDLAYLCFRLSLGQNLSTKKGNHINFLVLDEVLGSQDSQRQYNIFLALANLKHKFSQILLISHHEDMKDLATHLIEVKKLDVTRSEVVVR